MNNQTKPKKNETSNSRSEQMRKSSTARKRKQRKRELFLVGGFLTLIAGVIAVLLFTVLFRINGITVENAAVRYTDEQIIAVSGIKTGESMLRFSEHAVAENLTEKLPYIGSVTLKYKFPDSVLLSVTYTRGALGFQTANGWVISDASGKVLENGLSDLPEYIGRVSGVTLTDFALGKKVTCEDKNLLAQLLSLCTSMQEYGYTDVTSYDLSDLSQVTVEIDGTIIVKLGNIENACEKLQFGKAVIDKNINSRFDDCLVIDLSTENTAYVREKSAIEATTLPTLQSDENQSDESVQADGTAQSKQTVG